MPSMHLGPVSRAPLRVGAPEARVRSKPSRGQCLAQVMLLSLTHQDSPTCSKDPKYRRDLASSSVTYLGPACEQLGKPKPSAHPLSHLPLKPCCGLAS